jgi:hypothetical protein
MDSHFDALVVGSGIGGLSFALKLAEAGLNVGIVTKKTKSDSNTNWAQGGIACVTSEDDSLASHVADTLSAGDGLCDRAVVEAVVAAGPARVRELIAWGVEFERGGDGLHDLGREGGHTRRRILHARDMTGRAIESALLLAVSASPNVRMLEHHLAVDLITSTAGTQATESQFYNVSNAAAGKAVFANIQASTDSDITRINIAVAGTADTSNDKLLLVGTSTDTIDLNTTAQTGTETISGIAVDWSYSTGKVLTISQTGGGAFTALQVQTIEQALQFKTATGATQGDRSFTISHTDLSGNTGTSAVETVAVDTTAPVFTSTTTASLTQSSVATTDVIYTAVATDTNSIAYTLSGTDSSLFNISAGGAVTFKTTQAASTKSDSGADGIYNFDVTATDAAGNATARAVAFTLSAPQPIAGQTTIELGGSYGSLIKGVQVEGKWYYHWDRSGDGTSANSTAAGQTQINGGTDNTDHNTLDGIFKYDINGTLNPNAGTDTTETFRYATLNGVQVALPTYGAGVDGSGKATSTGDKAGTAVSDTTTDNPTYNDLLAIWDAHNGASTSTGDSGVPAGWPAGGYWSATPSASGHAAVNLYLASVYDVTDDRNLHVALQVL